MPRHGTALVEIELQAQLCLGGIVILYLKYGFIYEAVRLFEPSRNCLDPVLKSKKVKFSEGQSFRRANRRGFGRLLDFILVLRFVLACLAFIRLSIMFFILIRVEIVIISDFIELICVKTTSPREVFFIYIECKHPNFFKKFLLSTVLGVFDQARYVRGYPALVSRGQFLANLEDIATQ